MLHGNPVWLKQITDTGHFECNITHKCESCWSFHNLNSLKLTFIHSSHTTNAIAYCKMHVTYLWSWSGNMVKLNHLTSSPHRLPVSITGEVVHRNNTMRESSKKLLSCVLVVGSAPWCEHDWYLVFSTEVVKACEDDVYSWILISFLFFSVWYWSFTN